MCRLCCCLIFDHERGVRDTSIIGIFLGLGFFIHTTIDLDAFGAFASLVHVAVNVLGLYGVIYKNSIFLIPNILVQPVEIILGFGAATHLTFVEVEGVGYRILAVSLLFGLMEILIYIWLANYFLYKDYTDNSLVILPIGDKNSVSLDDEIYEIPHFEHSDESSSCKDSSDRDDNITTEL